MVSKSHFKRKSRKPSASASRASSTTRRFRKHASKARRVLRGSKSFNKSKSFRPKGRIGKSTPRSRISHPRMSSAQRILHALATPQRYYHTVTSSLTAATGLQNVTELDFYTISELNEISSIVSGYTPSGPLQGGPQQLFFDRSWGNIAMTNSSSQPVVGTIYKVMVRRDCVDPPLKYWTSGMLQLDGGVPTGSLPGPVSPNSLPTAASLGVTPFMSPNFCSQFKVVKQWGFHLNSGEQRSYRVNLRTGRFDQSILNTITFGTTNTAIGASGNQVTPNAYYRGWTVSFLIVINGSTIHDTTTSSSISTAPVRLDILQAISYEWRTLSTSAPSVNYFSGLGTITVPTSYLNTGISATATNV